MTNINISKLSVLLKKSTSNFAVVIGSACCAFLLQTSRLYLKLLCWSLEFIKVLKTLSRNNAGNFCSLRHFLGWLITFAMPKFALQLQKEMISFFLSTQILSAVSPPAVRGPNIFWPRRRYVPGTIEKGNGNFFCFCLSRCFLEMLAYASWDKLPGVSVFVCVFCRVLQHT